MHADALDGPVVREPTVDDHRRVLAVLGEWWGGPGADLVAFVRRLQP